jgi:hypothetical protein
MNTSSVRRPTYPSTTRKEQTMDRSTPVSSANTPHPASAELQVLGREARRLRAEHARDPLASLAIALASSAACMIDQELKITRKEQTMNRSTPVSPANAPHPAPAELQDLEREARRLRAEHARDPLARLAIVFDLKVRRLAHRVAARVWASRRAPTSASR